MTEQMETVVVTDTFKSDGNQNSRVTIPAGLIHVTITTSTIKQPGYYCSGGHYNFRKRGDMAGAPGDWFASYEVVSQVGSTVQAYAYIPGAMEPDDIGAPVAVKYTKIG